MKLFCLVKSFLPFALTFGVGLVVVRLLTFSSDASALPGPVAFPGPVPVYKSGSGKECNLFKKKAMHDRTDKVNVLTKPSPGYTELARANNVQGTVALKVTFLANGTIGEIETVSELPDGLTEKAIEAARRIEFEPARNGGEAVTVTKTVEYTFSIY